MPTPDESITSPTESLPEFAAQWLTQWRRAAENLPKIREAELRQLDPGQLSDAMLLLDDAHIEKMSGLVIQQRWFMRQRLLETRDK